MKSGSCSPCSYRRTTQPLPYYPIPASCLSYNPCAEGRPRGLCTCTTTRSTRKTRPNRMCFNGPDQYSWAYFCVEFSIILLRDTLKSIYLRPKNMLKCAFLTKIDGLKSRGVYTYIDKKFIYYCLCRHNLVISVLSPKLTLKWNYSPSPQGRGE